MPPTVDVMPSCHGSEDMKWCRNGMIVKVPKELQLQLTLHVPSQPKMAPALGRVTAIHRLTYRLPPVKLSRCQVAEHRNIFKVSDSMFRFPALQSCPTVSHCQ